MLMSVPLIVNCSRSLTVNCGNISVREKTVKGTLSLGKPGKRSSMAVTGDETETGMFAIICVTVRSNCFVVVLKLCIFFFR